MAGEQDFHGAKAAIFIGEDILIYRRDDDPEIPFANMLDFPGGGREGDETGAECVARETREEFGLSIAPEKFEYVEAYENWRKKGAAALFYVCSLPEETVHDIVFGNEGQDWQTIAVDEFLARRDAVPHLQKRLTGYINR